jgi:hypothetical protein
VENAPERLRKPQEDLRSGYNMNMQQQVILATFKEEGRLSLLGGYTE